MDIEKYLAEGGVLSNPSNVPPRYRAELMKLMATFVDSELAGAAGFADIINCGPGIKERIAAARIVLEKTDHAERVLAVMGEFGADESRYVNAHPWAARLDRDANIGASRSENDMRLALFNYPLTGWTDAVVMNLLMGLAVDEQLKDMALVSYQPLAEVLREITPREARHTELAREGVERLMSEDKRAEIEAGTAYWWPRVAASFSTATDEKFARLKAVGLRSVSGAEQRKAWERKAAAVLSEFGLATPH